MSPAPPPQPLLHDIGECAFHLRVHRATVSRLIRSGALPAVHIGSRTLIRRVDLEALLERLAVNGVPAELAARGQRIRAARELKRGKRK